MLSILNLNVRSLKKHSHDLEALIYSLESPPHILCLTETFLKEDDDIKSLLVTGYSQFLVKNRETRCGGGMIQVRNDITLLREENIDLPEAVFAKLMKDNYHFNIVVIYNKPRANKIEFVNSLDSFLENISSESTPTVICGDFNIDILKPNLLTKKTIEM